MNMDNYEQFNLWDEVIQDNKYFLSEWDKVIVQIFNERPINIQVEPAVVLTVLDTPPGEKWDTATGWKKPATLSSGLVVPVPLFVKIWDKLKIDTRTKEYLNRV